MGQRHQGRPHWAKENLVDYEYLKKSGLPLDEFNAVREQLDPKGTFMNSYLKSKILPAAALAWTRATPTLGRRSPRLFCNVIRTFIIVEQLYSYTRIQQHLLLMWLCICYCLPTLHMQATSVWRVVRHLIHFILTVSDTRHAINALIFV